MAFTLPFGIRVAAGLLGTAIDRLGRLPGELPTLGVTLAGQLVKTSFRVRQDIAELATRGDDLLSGLTGGAQEHPAWATFDEDEEEPPSATGSRSANPPDPAPAPTAPTAMPPTAAKPRATATPRVTASRNSTAAAPAKPRRATRPAGAPEPVQRAGTRKPRNRVHNTNSPTAGAPAPGVPTPDPTAGTPTPDPIAGPIGSNHRFSIADLKERLLELDVSAVRDLLDQEAAGPNRAAYLTLLTNRLTTLEHQNR